MVDNLLESIKKLDLSKVGKKEEDMDNMLKSMQESKISSIKEMIRDINEQIRNRTILDREILADIEKLKTQLNNFITEVASSMQGNPEGVKAVAELRKKFIEIEELSLAEKLNYWRDAATLKKELREHNEELINIESKDTLIDSLI